MQGQTQRLASAVLCEDGNQLGMLTCSPKALIFGLKNQMMHWESRESLQDRDVKWFGVMVGERGAKQTSL
jgi:hypothetical protein